ncbi:MAG TPA: FAD-dependent oxidoreductase, partial [Candidatus Eisenbacteria bacterium]
MRRDLDALADRTFDLVVIGGGAFGVFTAWDAALRGISVAILERGDWAEAASANCFKMVHGGIRYLQHLDFPRIRQSSRERNTFLRIAPHLVRPLPILIPTYGHGHSGPEILGAGLRAYDLLVWDRNRGIRDPALRLPAGRLLSTRETLALYPELPTAGLTGGALIHDGQMHSPARLALCVLRSAVEHGACAANYVEVTGFLRRGNEIEGVTARDRERDASFTVRGRAFVNAAGAWAAPLLHAGLGIPVRPRPTFSRDAFFVVNRRIGPDV